jgi:hypothetical protein
MLRRPAEGSVRMEESRMNTMSCVKNKQGSEEKVELLKKKNQRFYPATWVMCKRWAGCAKEDVDVGIVVVGVEWAVPDDVVYGLKTSLRVVALRAGVPVGDGPAGHRRLHPGDAVFILRRSWDNRSCFHMATPPPRLHDKVPPILSQ